MRWGNFHQISNVFNYNESSFQDIWFKYFVRIWRWITMSNKHKQTLDVAYRIILFRVVVVWLICDLQSQKFQMFGAKAFKIFVVQTNKTIHSQSWINTHQVMIDCKQFCNLYLSFMDIKMEMKCELTREWYRIKRNYAECWWIAEKYKKRQRMLENQQHGNNSINKITSQKSDVDVLPSIWP